MDGEDDRPPARGRSDTRAYGRLSWTPRARLDVLRRIPFLIENQYSEPGTWAAHNEAALHSNELLPQVQILRLFEVHEEELFEAATRALVSDPVTFRTTRASAPASTTGITASSCAIWRSRCAAAIAASSAPTATTSRCGAPSRATRRTSCAQRCSPFSASSTRSWRPILAPRPCRPQLQELVTRTIEFGLDGVEAGYEETGAAAASSSRRARAVVRHSDSLVARAGAVSR